MAESILITFKKFPVYRGAGLAAAVVVALLFVTSFAAKPAGAQETIVADENYTLNESTSVYGTSLPVRKGDRVVFTASGAIWPAGKANPFYPSTGPEGYDEIADCSNPNSNWPAPCARKFSLLAQIDTINRSGGWHYIGRSQQLVYGKDEQGSVYLSHNDDVPNNGEGSFQVNVKIYRDITPPNTTITSAPPSATNSRQAGFNFSSSEDNSTFECKLDGGAYEACNSGKIYSNLSDGQHTFLVRAKDSVGNVDPSPAKYEWTVDATAPTVETTTPADGATGVRRNTNLSATFSKKMDSSTLSASTITLKNTKTGQTVTDVGVRTTKNSEGKTVLTLDPFASNATTSDSDKRNVSIAEISFVFVDTNSPFPRVATSRVIR